MEKEEKTEKGLTKTQAILMILANSPTYCLPFSEMQQKLGISDKELSLYLYRLRKRGAVKGIWKKGEKGRVRVYCLKVKEQLLE